MATSETNWLSAIVQIFASPALSGIVGALVGGAIAIVAVRYQEKLRADRERMDRLQKLEKEIERNNESCLEFVRNPDLIHIIRTEAWDTAKNYLENLSEDDYRKLLEAYLCTEAINNRVIGYIQAQNEIAYQNPTSSQSAGLHNTKKSLQKSFNVLATYFLQAQSVAKKMLPTKKSTDSDNRSA